MRVKLLVYVLGVLVFSSLAASTDWIRPPATVNLTNLSDYDDIGVVQNMTLLLNNVSGNSGRIDALNASAGIQDVFTTIGTDTGNVSVSTNATAINLTGGSGVTVSNLGNVITWALSSVNSVITQFTGRINFEDDVNVTGNMNVSETIGAGNLLPLSNDTGNIGLENQRWHRIYVEILNVSELGGYSPIIVSSPIFSSQNITAPKYFGSGEFLTDINNSGFANFSGNSSFSNISNFAENASFANSSLFSNNATFASGVNWYDITNMPDGFFDDVDNDTIFNDSGLSQNQTQFFINISELTELVEGITTNLSNITVGAEDFDWIIGNGILYNDTNGTRIGIGTNNPMHLLDIRTTAINTTLNQTISPEGVVLWYDFENDDGLTIVDKSIYGRNGTITGTVTHEASKGGNGTGNFSVLFGGTNDYIITPEHSTFNKTTNFSFAFWYDWQGNNEQIFYKNVITSGLDFYAVQMQAGKLCFQLDIGGVGQGRRTDSSVNDNEWHHYAVQVVDGNIEIYRNSVLQSLQNCNINNVAGSTDLFIGINAILDDDSDSYIDEIVFYNATVNTTVIENLYNNGITEVIGSTLVNVTSGGSKFEVSEGGDIHVYGTGTSIFDGDVQIVGNLIGGSPVKIVGGFKVIDGGIQINDGDFTVVDGDTNFYSHVDVRQGNINVVDNITAQNSLIGQEFIDLTPAYDKNKSEAVKEIKEIKKILKEDGTLVLNHSSLPDFVRRDVDYFGTDVEGRSLGAMVSILVEAVQSLSEENTLLKAELCVEKKYSWCPEK